MPPALLASATSTPVTIPDVVLRRAVERQLEKTAGATITRADMATLQFLQNVRGVASLSGLEHAVNLRYFVAEHGSITDLSPLTGLTKLELLLLASNSISNVSPLSGLRMLRILSLQDNLIEDIGPVAANALAPDRPVRLRDLYLVGNPLNDEAIDTHIPAMRRAGAVVSFGRRPPPPPPAIELSLEQDAAAPEGGTAWLTVRRSVVQGSATTFNWRVAVDADPATADADADDYAPASGSATIPAGEVETTLAIKIADDADIEPAREWFDVVLEEPPAGADWTLAPLGRARAKVAVEEGVCDRTPAVRDALRGDAECHVPTPAMLAAVEDLSVSDASTLLAGDFQGLSELHTLSLAGNGLEQLPAGLFAGLEGLRTLDLSDNQLAALPPEAFASVPALQALLLEDNAFNVLPVGLFSRLGNLVEASLAGNPGTPFPLAVQLERTDSDPHAPPPATVVPRIAAGAPFPMTVALAGMPSAVAATLPATLEIPAGAVSGEPFRVEASLETGVDLQAGATVLSTARCGDERATMPCFRGFEAVPGDALHLFLRPPRALEPPAPRTLFGDVLELSLSTLVAPGGASGSLRWHATSSDEGVATVAVRQGMLIVEPEPGAEGEATIEVVATDSTGRSVTVRFSVTVAFNLPRRGWRTATLPEPER